MKHSPAFNADIHPDVLAYLAAPMPPMPPMSRHQMAYPSRKSVNKVLRLLDQIEREKTGRNKVQVIMLTDGEPDMDSKDMD